MLTVHHLNNSRSQRIVWLCEELGIEYKLVKHQRNPETQRSPESLNKVHPLGKAPTLPSTTVRSSSRPMPSSNTFATCAPTVA